MSKPKSMGLAKRDARDEVIENFAFKTWSEDSTKKTWDTIKMVFNETEYDGVHSIWRQCGRFLWARQWIFEFHKLCGFYWSSERQSAFQKEMHSME
jgi:hypothetical protein